MKFTHAVVLGLAAAVVVTGGISAGSTHGKPGTAQFGPNCQPLTLIGANLAKGYSQPSVCVIRDTAGKRFYLFSGVLRFVAGPPVQARFGVSHAVPLSGATLVPVIGYRGTDQSDIYEGYGVVEANGQITIRGTKRGWLYTVSLSGQIPADMPVS